MTTFNPEDYDEEKLEEKLLELKRQQTKYGDKVESEEESEND